MVHHQTLAKEPGTYNQHKRVLVAVQSILVRQARLFHALRLAGVPVLVSNSKDLGAFAPIRLHEDLRFQVSCEGVSATFLPGVHRAVTNRLSIPGFLAVQVSEPKRQNQKNCSPEHQHDTIPHGVTLHIPS